LVGWLLYEKENLNDGLDIEDIYKLLKIFNEETFWKLEESFWETEQEWG